MQCDVYDGMRRRWEAGLTGGEGLDRSDLSVAARIESLEKEAGRHWAAMNADCGWNDLADSDNGSHITASAERLMTMAKAWATAGSSLCRDDRLAADLVTALRRLLNDLYHERIPRTMKSWWHLEIGTPLHLTNLAVLLFERLSPGDVRQCIASINAYSPDAEGLAENQYPATGANRIWKCLIIGLCGVLGGDGSRIEYSVSAMRPVYPYVTEGDGFYRDGSFIQHRHHPYTGGYGRSIMWIAKLAYLLDGTPWAVEDEAKQQLAQWIYDSFEPVMYRGVLLEGVRGREIARRGTDDRRTGHDVIQIVLQLSLLDTAHAGRLRGMAKQWMLEDTYANFLDTCEIGLLGAAKALIRDERVAPRGELIAHRQFPCMDRVVHHRPGFACSVSMSSKRIATFESLNGENLKGWHQGDGAAYLYTGRLNEFSDAYWPTVDPSRLPGTTVECRSRSDGEGANYLSDEAWCGGTSLFGTCGFSGMRLRPANSLLTCNKAWFMLDDEIVALGSAIRCPSDNPVETIVENRKLGADGAEELHIDGALQPAYDGWTDEREGPSWMHLEGTGGYVFLQPGRIQVKRERRIGAWRDINVLESDESIARHYLTILHAHGRRPDGEGYGYVLLPNRTAEQTRDYAASPEVSVLVRSPEVTAVRKSKPDRTAAAFWTEGRHSAGIIACDAPAAVMVGIQENKLTVAVADPTHARNRSIELEIGIEAASILTTDARIVVKRISPTIRLSVDTEESQGATAEAVFIVSEGAEPHDL